MAYGEKYYLDYYDRFNNLIKVRIYQDGYTGAVIDLTGSGSPAKIHWLGEGEDKYSVIKGSTCELSLISTTDEQFLNLFIDTSRKYYIGVFNDATLLWSGYVDPDSYRESYLAPPYVSVIHANDGLGDLKDIRFPKPDSSDYYTLEQPLIYYIANCLRQTGFDKTIYVANNIAFTGATKAFSEAYLPHFVFRDEENEWEYCYDILEKILLSFGCRLYQWNGSWYIERLDYFQSDTVDYNIYTYEGVYTGDLSAQDRRLAFTGVSGSPMCVFVDQSPELEIVPALKKFTLNQMPGERQNIIYFTDAMGEFSDDEFQHPTSGVGPLTPRYWSWVDNYDGWNAYSHDLIKYPGTDYVRLKGITVGDVEALGSRHDWPYLNSDTIQLDAQSLNTYASLKLKLVINADFYSEIDEVPFHKPYIRFNMRLFFPNAEWSGGDLNQGYISPKAGSNLTLYLKEVNSKIYITTAENFWLNPYGTDADFTPGQNTMKADSPGLKEYTATLEAIPYAYNYTETPYINVRIFPLAVSAIDLELLGWGYPPNNQLTYLDVYNARLTLIDEAVDTESTGTVDVDSNNRRTKDFDLYLTSGTAALNPRYFNKYVPVKSDSSLIGATWTKDGASIGSLSNLRILEAMAQYNRPTRKITGEILSEDIHFGSILTDTAGRKFFCTGVEYDTKFNRWNGEWIQLYDPDTADSGDYDADDYGGDFWAI